MRIRHFGFLANRFKRQARARCRKLFDLDPAGGATISHSLSQRLAAKTHRRRSTGFVELTSLGFFMNKAPSHLISFDSRSAGLPRVCPALAKTDSKPTWQRRNQRKAIGVDLNRPPFGHCIFTKAPFPARPRHVTIPIAEAAQLLRGLVQPRFIPSAIPRCCQAT